jgi:transketolase
VDDELRAVNVVRGLAMDAVQKANSGHPGTPMSLAPLAHVLFTRIMRYDAGAPDWPDRDRFVLSAGHASMLLYANLYLTGFGLTLDDLQAFRQWGSRTPGHPERGHTPGVEVTTGPLGQGLANSTGLALAERHLRDRFGADLCDHHTFVIAGDGDLEEGVSHEAASLAGHLALGRLVVIYDDNHISIDGPTELALSDDAGLRFQAYGWHVEEVGEIANDLDALEAAIRRAMAVEDRPSFIRLRSHIGYPSPKVMDTAKAHGDPLGEDEVRVVKEILGLPVDEHFWVPDDVLDFYRAAGHRGAAAREEWEARLAQAKVDRPGIAEEFELAITGRGRPGWDAKLPQWQAGEKLATRVACTEALNAVLDGVPGLLGGGADLTGNTGTALKGAGTVGPDSAAGRQIHFGVREHGMGAALNGMAAHGLLPFGGTFLVFSDYMRPAVRLAALSHLKAAFVWSHDSVGLGEDGPTHQPIEHLAALRAIPGLTVIRPADANEVSAAWRVHIEGTGPTAIILTRQGTPVLEGTAEKAREGVARGAYVLVEEEDPEALDLVLVGTGSEVALCVTAAAQLAEEGWQVRVVSMPSWELFGELDEDDQEDVLPQDVPTIAIEAGSTFGWERWADDAIGIDTFGASAPGPAALEKFGFSAQHLADRARELLAELEELDLELDLDELEFDDELDIEPRPNGENPRDN